VRLTTSSQVGNKLLGCVCAGLMRGEWPARWEPQEEGMMSIAASFPSVRNQGYVDQEWKVDNATEGDAC
jgi:hypothetical protein